MQLTRRNTKDIHPWQVTLKKQGLFVKIYHLKWGQGGIWPCQTRPDCQLYINCVIRKQTTQSSGKIFQRLAFFAPTQSSFQEMIPGQKCLFFLQWGSKLLIYDSDMNIMILLLLYTCVSACEEWRWTVLRNLFATTFKWYSKFCSECYCSSSFVSLFLTINWFININLSQHLAIKAQWVLI